jgi:hypothetical protein
VHGIGPQAQQFSTDIIAPSPVQAKQAPLVYKHDILQPSATYFRLEHHRSYERKRKSKGRSTKGISWEGYETLHKKAFKDRERIEEYGGRKRSTKISCLDTYLKKERHRE